MRRCRLLAMSLGLALAACGGSETSQGESAETARADAERFGAAVTLAEASPISGLASQPGNYAQKEIRVEGVVAAVCKGMGCWVEVRASDGSSIIARSLDHSVTVPMDCEGRSIVVQGLFQAMPVDPETEAEHSGEDHDAAEGHVCPAPEYVLSMDAVELRAKAESI